MYPPLVAGTYLAGLSSSSVRRVVETPASRKAFSTREKSSAGTALGLNAGDGAATTSIATPLGAIVPGAVPNATSTGRASLTSRYTADGSGTNQYCGRAAV